ncbi:MAG TPA: hypothetical protein VHU23_10765 [Rhizomicrobium sp.]|jgi:hypothetical protein|nr:hypothetical protein [Rhizomicrobium sp.]
MPRTEAGFAELGLARARSKPRGARNYDPDAEFTTRNDELAFLAPAVYASQFGPQSAKPSRLVEGHAPLPTAPFIQMEKINPQTLIPAG